MLEKRVVITGATGFIGRALVDELTANGYRVVAVTRNTRRGRGRWPEAVTVAGWDGRTAKGWGALVDGAAAVVNLAGDNLGRGRWTRKKKRRILRSRTEAGRAVVEAVRTAGMKPAAVVQASAVGAYGTRGDKELDENSDRGRGFLASVVERWEESTAAVASFGVRHVVIRSGLVLGRGGGVWPRLVLPFRFFAGGPLGDGRQWFSWISLRDEVRAIRFLIERERLDGIFNLTAPRPRRERELCRVIGKAMKRPCWLSMPASTLKLLFGAKVSETLLAGQRVYPRRLVEAGFEFRHPDAELAVEELLRARPRGEYP